MQAVLPGRPLPKLQAFGTALWNNVRFIAYVSGAALVILSGPNKLLQTIYLDDVELLGKVAIDEASGSIAVNGGRDIFVYEPLMLGDAPQWRLNHNFSCQHDETITSLSWGSSGELLTGGSYLTLWLLHDIPRIIWQRRVSNVVQFAQFSPDGAVIASAGRYDRLVKLWRRLTFGTEDVRFEVSYLRHPASVTGMHWRLPLYREETMDNVLYTMCADSKIKIWTATDRQRVGSPLQYWGEIDMMNAIQQRIPDNGGLGKRRYGLIIDSRDFCSATENSVKLGAGNGEEKRTLEHLVEVANRTPEICLVFDHKGYMSAWGLENINSRTKSTQNIFNIMHVEGVHFSFLAGIPEQEEYTQLGAFCGGLSEDSITLIAHHFDGRIEWLDAKTDVLFDPSPHKKRLVSRALWTGHSGPLKKIIRNVSGKFLVSRSDENKAVIWRQRSGPLGSGLREQSSLDSDVHIHRTCLTEDGRFLLNLHHDSVSLWDVQSTRGKQVAKCGFRFRSKPLCILLLPTAEAKPDSSIVYVAAIAADMSGMAWEIHLPSGESSSHQYNGSQSPTVEKFDEFSLEPEGDVLYILPVDPAGSEIKITGFLDVFAVDIAMSYTRSGVLKTWTAKVNKQNRKVEWLNTSTVETGICNPSLASGASIRKAAVVDQNRSRLTIWDTYNSQLEFEEVFSQKDIIRDLDWTSTPDYQTILAVGFPQKVVLLTQLRYDYLDEGPSWAQIREIRIRDLTPHPIGDSCWLGNGALVVGTGNQLFVYNRDVELDNPLVAGLRLHGHRGHKHLNADLFEVVSRLNGPLPVWHPQFLSQCILCGKSSMVHLILTTLHQKLKFWVEGDDLDTFLNIPMVDMYKDTEILRPATWSEIKPTYSALTDALESYTVDENVAAALHEKLTHIVLPQLTSREQFRLVDIVECVATVEKHKQSMDGNGARYFLFFREHMMRRGQKAPNAKVLSWREIVWAFHSNSHEILTDLVSRQYNGRLLWENARESGMFMWITDITALRTQLEIVARNEYTRSEERNPVDCSLFYLALRKKTVLQGLWRIATWNREQSATLKLLSQNFNDPRWKTAALKNAYALLGKRRFGYAAAFFLLGDHLRDAVAICLGQLKDIQLAIVITRTYEGDDSPVLREILEDNLLPIAAAEGNRWMATWAFWMLSRRDMAVRTLISPIESLLHSPRSPGSPGEIALQAKSYLSNDPALIILYHQLREKTMQTLRGASQIPPKDEWEFVMRSARLYARMGCDLLALNLVAEWQFLPPGIFPLGSGLPSRRPPMTENISNRGGQLARRQSIVIADLPPSALEEKQDENKPPPSTFVEPDADSLLDSFGF